MNSIYLEQNKLLVFKLEIKIIKQRFLSEINNNKLKQEMKKIKLNEMYSNSKEELMNS